MSDDLWESAIISISSTDEVSARPGRFCRVTRGYCEVVTDVFDALGHWDEVLAD